MRGGYLLSFDDAIVAKVRRALDENGPEPWLGCDAVYVGDDGVQLLERSTDDLFTLDHYDDGYDLEHLFRDPPHHPQPGVRAPDMTAVLGYSADCRSEALFARLVRAVAEVSGQPAWVLDDDRTIWDARAVDPDRVRL